MAEEAGLAEGAPEVIAPPVRYAYVIGGLGPLKLGYCRDLIPRLQDIRRRRAEPDLRVLASWSVPHDDAPEVERLAHYILRQRGIGARGEWVSTDLQTAIEVCAEAVAAVARGEMAPGAPASGHGPVKTLFETLLVRLPEGTRASIEALQVEGEQLADTQRRVVLAGLDAVEQAASRKPVPQPKPPSATTARRQRRT